MNLENLTPNQLEAEYERAVPLISQYLPVFLEMKKKEVINTMVTSPDAKCVMEQKAIYSYLNGLQNVAIQQKEEMNEY